MNRLKCLVLLFFLAGFLTVYGQEDFYAPHTVHEIRIRFEEQGWRHTLDSLFEHVGDEGKLIGDVTIDGYTYRDAGIRYKGYSSYNADEIKNPFNIDLDYIINNQNHLGHVKIKLSNVIHDPSFVREVLSYEIARKYMPASGAGFVNLYVNDTLIGLYTNVEAVDGKFTKKFWGSDQNSFFKGEPQKLQYPFGQNANLALTHGADSSGYMPFYNLESVTGWNDLYDLIYRLDAGSLSAMPALNIDRALWMHAFNEVLLNLDSYIGYSQNYYMYRDDNGQFNPIVWDLNMSFGSFRDSDGSKNFQGITIPEIKQLDPLALMDFAITPRPLMTNLFKDDTLRRMYFAHMRTILDENIQNGWYFSRAQELQTMISQDVFRDTNRFYSYDDFLLNLTETVGGSGSMKLYPGLRDLMEARLAYLNSLPGFSGQPVISEVDHFPDLPVASEPCWITARIQDASLVMLGYRNASGGLFSRISMADDGSHHDGAAGDGVFGAQITTSGHTIQFYIYAENEVAGIFAPERAEYEFYAIQPAILPGDIVLNELCSGTGEPWIELLNTTTEPLDVSGMQLSDDPSMPAKWILTDTLVPAKKYLLVDPSAGALDAHTAGSFALPVNGGYLQLANASGIVLDSATYGNQVPGKSTGRYPNGYGPWNLMPPTKGSFNHIGFSGSDVLVFPNPGNSMVYLEMEYTSGPVTWSIYNAMGKKVLEKTYLYSTNQMSSIIQPIDISNLDGGLHVVSVNRNGEIATKKLIIL